MKILRKTINYHQDIKFYIDNSINSIKLNINLADYDRAIIFYDLNI